MASAGDDDMPALESEPLLFSLTSLSEAASVSAPVKKGQKRSRESASSGVGGEEEEEEEESSEEDEEEEEEAGIGTAEGQLEDGSGGDAKRVKKEGDVDGIARAHFPVVQTIHATAFLGQEIDVKTVARRCINACYMPPSCVRFTIRNPEGIAMVYASGKYVCMGGKSTVDMVTIARKVARKIQRIGNQRGAEVYKTIGFHNFSLNNISAHAALGYRLNLRALSEDPAFMDYTEYEPEQWKGLHYRLPVDPNKTLADLIPSYGNLIAQRHRKEQFSNDEFLGQGDHSLAKGSLSYYATTGSTRATANLKPGERPFIKVPASLQGQILTATIYGNGRLTLTGVRKEKDVYDAYYRLWYILRPFATTIPAPHPPARPPYPRAFLPGQRRLIKREQEAAQKTRAMNPPPSTFPQVDIKPNIVQPSSNVASAMFVLPSEAFQQPQQVTGTFATVKAEGGVAPTSSISSPPTVIPSTTQVKAEPAPGVKAEGGSNVGSATIVIEGLPEQAANVDEEVEWE